MNETNNASFIPCVRPGCAAVLAIANSIAHEEEALACILNAECAKINKAIQTCQCFNQLIEVNNSVQATIEQVAALEGVLKAKLDAIAPLLAECV